LLVTGDREHVVVVVVVVVVVASRRLTPHATRLKFASSRVVVSRRASAARAT
jgi:hypothetical protein